MLDNWQYFLYLNPRHGTGDDTFCVLAKAPLTSGWRFILYLCELNDIHLNR